MTTAMKNEIHEAMVPAGDRHADDRTAARAAVRPWGDNTCAQSIGGEMECDALELAAAPRPSSSWPFGDYVTVSTGRIGLHLALETIDESGPFLLPSYLCDSMLQPFREKQLPLSFYWVTDRLRIDTAGLLALVRDVRPAGIVFVNYFGFPVSEAETHCLREAGKTCWIIEDCVQGSLIEEASPVVGHTGHFVVSSFRKILRTPDGGLLVNRSGRTLPSLQPADEEFVRKRWLAKCLRHEWMRRGVRTPGLESLYLRLFAEAEAVAQGSIVPRAMSMVSRRLLARTDLSVVRGRRRDNFLFLLEAFRRNRILEQIGKPLFRELPEGVSPLAFPITLPTERRDPMASALVRERVFCPVHWRLPACVQGKGFSGSEDLSRRILSLPIDQRYTRQDMQVVIERLERAWASVERGRPGEHPTP